MTLSNARLEKLINDVSAYAAEGWSFNVCMSKAGIRGQSAAIALAKTHKEIADIKKYCEDRRHKLGFAASASIYGSR